MRYVRFLLVFGAVGLLTACATEGNYRMAVRSWDGGSEQQLFRSWGYPDRIRKMPNGHRLLIYRSVNKGKYPFYTTGGNTTVTTSGGNTTVSSSPTVISGGGSYDFRCTTWFEVNRAGRIVNTSFRGNNCVANKSFLGERSR